MLRVVVRQWALKANCGAPIAEAGCARREPVPSTALTNSGRSYPLTLVTPSAASAGALGPGDVVSYADVNGDDGHTNVVTSTAPFNGTGSITTLNENTGGFITIKVKNWNFGLDDFHGHYMAAT